MQLAIKKTITLYTYLIVTVILIISSLQCTSSEYHEFNVTLPMILTSLRTFEKTSVQQPEPLYVSKMKNGTAILRAEEGYGLMAVVQEMNLLNRVTADSSLPQNCVDYVQISSINGTRTTGAMCGYSVGSVGKGNNKSNFKPAFVDKTGQIELSYLISERVRLSPFDGYITNFNLSVTPFIECPEDAFPFGNEEWTPCSRIDSFSCIPADLFCDGVINCGFPGEFGLDEMNCRKRKPQITKQEENKLDGPVILSPPPTIQRSAETFSFSDSKNQPYDPYVAQDEGIWRLEDPTSINEHEDIQRVYASLPSVSYARLGNGFGVLLLLCLLISLFSTSWKKYRRSSSSDQMLSYDAESLQSNDTNENSKALLASSMHCTDDLSYFDIERDPAPPYRECVQPNSDYNYISGLFFESERPPSYEEIKVHQSHPPSYRAA